MKTMKLRGGLRYAVLSRSQPKYKTLRQNCNPRGLVNSNNFPFTPQIQESDFRILIYGHVAHMGEEKGVYRVLLGKTEGKRHLRIPRHRWVDNIRMDLQEVGCGYMDWVWLAQDRDRWRTLVSAVMNLRVPRNAGNLLTSC